MPPKMSGGPLKWRIVRAKDGGSIFFAQISHCVAGPAQCRISANQSESPVVNESQEE